MRSSFGVYAPILLLGTNAVASILPETLYTKYKRADTFEWSAIGDSWATGVRAKDGDDYVKGSQTCLRTNYAYGPQLEKDPSWVGEKTEKFNFAACSGAVLHDMAAKDGGQQQVKNTGKPHLMTMTAGGNNAKFFDIATNCIYQQFDKDYGPEFADDKDGVGECAKAIKASKDYITGVEGDIGKDLNATIFDIVDSDQAKSYIDFFLYVTGYAHFFAVDDDWCDGQSFGAYPQRKPKLTLKLRQAINELTESLNNVYKDIVTKYNHKGMRYISITEGFSGHRFCEKPQWYQKPYWFNRQYYGTTVWIWNLSPPQLDSLDGSAADSTAVKSPPDGLQGNLFTADVPGWQQRPFHPKSPGYTAIKDSIIAQMKKDNIPETTPTCTPPVKGSSPSLDTAKKMNDDLDKHGDEDCCSGDGQCANLQNAVENKQAVDMCSAKGIQCIKCAQAANYLAGIIGACTVDGVVSGKQDINAMPGLSIQI